MKQMRRLPIVLVVLCGVAGTAVAQSNQIVDDLLSQEEAALGPTAYLVYSAAGVAAEDWDVQDAMERVRGEGWFDEQLADGPVTLGLFAYMVMRTFDLHGGVLYAAFPGPRYAAREFAFRSFVTGNTSPYRVLSGADVVNILGRVLDAVGQRESEEVSG